MYLSSEAKAEIFAKHGKSAADTGTAEGQVALFTYRIAHLTGHLKNNKHDFSTQLSLQKLVGKRRALLAYLFKKDIERYRAIIKALQLRISLSNFSHYYLKPFQKRGWLFTLKQYLQHKNRCAPKDEKRTTTQKR